MPIIKSAKKRVRVARKASIRNSKTKRSLKSALKLFHRKTTNTAHRSAQSAVDKAAKKGIVHKNKAARLKRQLSAHAKASGAKPQAQKTAAKKSATKRVAKAPAKKPTVKKPAAKKTK